MTRLALFALLTWASSLHAAPLRVLVASDADAFRADYSAALRQAGAETTTTALPDAAQLAHADVLVLHTSKLEPLPGAAQTALAAFA